MILRLKHVNKLKVDIANNKPECKYDLQTNKVCTIQYYKFFWEIKIVLTILISV